MSRRKKRVLTPELTRRWELKVRLDHLGLRVKDIAANTKFTPSSFTRWFNCDTEISEVEQIILKAISKKEKEVEMARKNGELIYV